MSGSGINQGELIDGRYRIMHRLGTGGMADVFLAEDQMLERQVALKLLHRRFAEDPGFVERFRREAQAAANLQHPNVVSVYDRGSWDGTYYIAMEFLQGRTLKQVVRNESPIDPVRAIDITIQILKATRFAHRRGIIHRDLKPHNVMVDDQDHAKVADFGIARAGASDMTETGSIMGTAQYLSPEQAQGLAVGEGSDLYSVGVVLYELLTGRVPFDAESAVTIALKHVSEAPPLPSQFNPDIPPALEQTVLWALNKNAADRPQDADQFINVLEGIRESLQAGAGGQVTASMAALSAGAVGGAAAAALGEAAAGTGPHPRVQLGGQNLTDPSTAMHPLPGDSGALPVVGAPGTDGNGGGSGGGRPKRSRWSRTWPWLLGLIVMLLIAGAVVAFLATRSKERVVPIVVNLTQASATAKLEADGFNPTILQQTSTSPTGTVIYQSPLGQTKTTGTTVDITVSTGEGSTTVPAVVQLSRAQAIAQLHLSGLTVSRILTEPSTAVKKGEATRTDPQAGDDVSKGQGVVLYLSTGVASVSIPSVSGDNVQTAQSVLSAFTVIVTQKVSSTATAGNVLSQSPVGGTKALPGSTVTLVVAEKAPTVTVPNVVGQTYTEANATLTGLGFTVTKTTELTGVSAQAGEVVSQSPTATSTSTQGSTVTLVVAKYSAAAPTNSTTTSIGTLTTTNPISPPTTPTTATTPAPTTVTTGTDTSAQVSTSTTGGM